MVLIPFCRLSLVREGWLPQGIQEQMRSPKLSPNHKRRIKTNLDQFRNTHARPKLLRPAEYTSINEQEIDFSNLCWNLDIDFTQGVHSALERALREHMRNRMKDLWIDPKHSLFIPLLYRRCCLRIVNSHWDCSFLVINSLDQCWGTSLFTEKATQRFPCVFDHAPNATISSTTTGRTANPIITTTKLLLI